mmetsp:Transcript_64283/g.158182  ORF Transcript_64283/g.158182 Transcript_64283/m.158182 type:complete len:214 (+) Transcript_64283:303-944(+)
MRRRPHQRCSSCSRATQTSRQRQRQRSPCRRCLKGSASRRPLLLSAHGTASRSRFSWRTRWLCTQETRQGRSLQPRSAARPIRGMRRIFPAQSHLWSGKTKQMRSLVYEPFASCAVRGRKEQHSRFLAHFLGQGRRRIRWWTSAFTARRLPPCSLHRAMGGMPPQAASASSSWKRSDGLPWQERMPKHQAATFKCWRACRLGNSSPRLQPSLQ